MRWLELQRMWRAAGGSGPRAAAACGGDNDGGTGPGGGGFSGTYRLVGIGEDGLPEVEQVENCSPARFTGGSMVLDGSGSFELSALYDDENGQDGFQDHGRFQHDGDGGLAFSSESVGRPVRGRGRG